MCLNSVSWRSWDQILLYHGKSNKWKINFARRVHLDRGLDFSPQMCFNLLIFVQILQLSVYISFHIVPRVFWPLTLPTELILKVWSILGILHGRTWRKINRVLQIIYELTVNPNGVLPIPSPFLEDRSAHVFMTSWRVRTMIWQMHRHDTLHPSCRWLTNYPPIFLCILVYFLDVSAPSFLLYFIPSSNFWVDW